MHSACTADENLINLLLFLFFNSKSNNNSLLQRWAEKHLWSHNSKKNKYSYPPQLFRIKHLQKINDQYTSCPPGTSVKKNPLDFIRVYLDMENNNRKTSPLHHDHTFTQWKVAGKVVWDFYFSLDWKQALRLATKLLSSPPPPPLRGEGPPWGKL